MRLPLLVLAALLAAPLALAQTSGEIDATIALAPGAAPEVASPTGVVRLNASEDGERYAFDLALQDAYTTIEVRMRGFDVERPRQMVPSLVVPETEYPLFALFPHERIWEVDAPARVFHAGGAADDIVLRLGIPGPRNVKLLLTRDVTPPAFALGPVTAITPIGFLQNTTTDELAIADMQVRAVGETEWVRNPTPDYHVIQRFPVQGLDADTEHEVRVVFEDWAGNNVTSETYRVRTLARRAVPAPEVRALEPPPNATLANGSVTIRAAIDVGGTPLAPGGIALFLDKRPVTSDLVFQAGELRYTPPAPLAPGLHSVGVEATNDAGARGVARWTFTVEGEPAATPLPALVAVAALVMAARRRRAA